MTTLQVAVAEEEEVVVVIIIIIIRIIIIVIIITTSSTYNPKYNRPPNLKGPELYMLKSLKRCKAGFRTISIDAVHLFSWSQRLP